MGQGVGSAYCVVVVVVWVWVVWVVWVVVVVVVVVGMGSVVSGVDAIDMLCRYFYFLGGACIRAGRGAGLANSRFGNLESHDWNPTITYTVNNGMSTAVKVQCAHPSCSNLYKTDRIRRGRFCNNKKCPSRHKEKPTTVISPFTPTRAYPTTLHRTLSTIRCFMSLMSSVYDGNEVEDNTTHHHLRNVNVDTMRRNNIYHLDHLLGLDESFIYLMFGFTQKEHVWEFRSGVLCAMALQLREVMEELVIGGKAVWVDVEGELLQNTATTTDEASSPPVDEQHNPETAFESVQGTDMGLELRHTELGEDANMDQLLKTAEAMLLLQQGAGPCFNTYR
jgi:hypothetical protein